MSSRPEGFNFAAAKVAAKAMLTERKSEAVDPGMGTMAILLAEQLVREIHVLNKMLPACRRLDLCPTCGGDEWSRPLLSGIDFELDFELSFELDFDQRQCATCGQVRSNPSEAAGDKQGPKESLKANNGLSARSVACDGWKQLPGMRYWVEVAGGVFVWARFRGETECEEIQYSVFDFDDAATLGCIEHVLLPEAWGVETIDRESWIDRKTGLRHYQVYVHTTDGLGCDFVSTVGWGDCFVQCLEGAP